MITEYRDTDGFRRYELSYEGVRLVLLDEKAPKEFRNNLLAFGQDLQLSWQLSPPGEIDDYIVNLWIKDSHVWAGSWSCWDHKLDYITGDVLKKIFNK